MLCEQKGADLRPGSYEILKPSVPIGAGYLFGPILGPREPILDGWVSMAGIVHGLQDRARLLVILTGDCVFTPVAVDVTNDQERVSIRHFDSL